MMTTLQLKAARALLDWTQQDLAKAVGMHLNVINNIERGITNPRQQTVDRLKKTLEDNGIIFIGTRGVELKKQAVAITKLEGEHFVRDLKDDILSVTKSANDEVLSIIADLRNFESQDPAGNKRYQEEKTARGFREKLITRAIPGFYPRNSKDYRTLEAAQLGTVDTIIYGDRTAFIFWPMQEIIIMKGQSMADSQRCIFESLWHTGHEPLRTARASED